VKTRAFLVLLILLAAEVVSAQCPQCKNALEEARKNGSEVGTSLNAGILYLLALPYSIAMAFGVVWYRNLRNKKKADV
jgi:high-affinity nickel permease